MTRLRRHRRLLGWCMIVLTLLNPAQSNGAMLFWAQDDTSFSSGVWTTTTVQWADTAPSSGDPEVVANTQWNNSANDIAVFGNITNGNTVGTLSLGEPITVGGIRFEVFGTQLNGSAVNTLTFAGGATITLQSYNDKPETRPSMPILLAPK